MRSGCSSGASWEHAKVTLSRFGREDGAAFHVRSRTRWRKNRSPTEARVLFTLIDGFSAAQQGFLLDWLEHEAAHQGQLIRYLYGLRLAIPQSWRKRYALSDPT
jgi:hypothetical protein